MYAENKLLDYILVGIIIVLITAISLMWYTIKNNEKANTHFDEKQIESVSYINTSTGDKFKMEKGKLYLTLGGEEIASGVEYDLNVQTGEIVYNNNKEKLYLRSVGKSNLSVWYEYAVYSFEIDQLAK